MINFYVEQFKEEFPPDEWFNWDTPSKQFEMVLKHEWMYEPFTEKVVNDIDKCSITKDGLIVTAKGEQMSPLNIAGGSKALILAAFFNDDSYVLNSRYMGDNCHKFLGEAVLLRKERLNLDLRFVVGNFFDMPYDTSFDGLSVQLNRKISTYRELYKIVVELGAFV